MRRTVIASWTGQTFFGSNLFRVAALGVMDLNFGRKIFAALVHRLHLALFPKADTETREQ